MNKTAARTINSAPRLVVYTVLIGHKEALNNPLQLISDHDATDLIIDYRCFTDNPRFASPIWQPLVLSNPTLPPEKLSRHPKALPHRYFSDYDYSLYIDNTVVFKRLPQQHDLLHSRLRAFRHPWRKNPLDEADVVVRSGLDEPQIVAQQMLHYRQHTHFAKIDRLTAGTVILRNHHDPQVQQFGEIWWDQILQYSKRDQLSLDLAADLAQLPVEYYPGTKSDNDLFLWPVVPNGRRVLASFDDDRYRWQHRQFEAAMSNPRQHYLESGKSDDYTRTVNLLEYCCHLEGSGAGVTTAPRRALTPILQPLLNQLNQRNSTAPLRIAVVAVFSEAILAPDLQELLTLKSALKRHQRFYRQSEIELSELQAGDLNDPNPYTQLGGKNGFELLILLGAPGAAALLLAQKFAPLLTADGAILCQLTNTLPLAISQQLVERYADYQITIYDGHHISQPGPIAANLLLMMRQQPRNHIIYCDGGLSNRLNGLLFGLVLARHTGGHWHIAWPRNNWCGAALDDLFHIDRPFDTRNLADFSHEKIDLHYLMHENQLQFHTQRISSSRILQSLDQAVTLVQQQGATLYYNNLLPPFATPSMLCPALAELRLKPDLVCEVAAFADQYQIDERVVGLHIRKTDFGQQIDEEALFLEVSQQSQQRHFVCSDDLAVIDRFASLPNVICRRGDEYPQRLQVDAGWNANIIDDHQRSFPFNITRTAAAIRNGLIDQVILSLTTPRLTSHSTFLSMAMLFKACDYLASNRSHYHV